MVNKVRPKNKQCDVETSFLPLLWYNKIMGVLAMEMPKSRSCSRLNIVYIISKYIAYGFLFWYGRSFVYQRPIFVPIVTVIYDVVLHVNIGIALAAIVCGFINIKEMGKLIRKLTMIDESLEIFGMDPEYAVAYQENLIIVCVWCTISISIFIMDFMISYYHCDTVFEALVRTSIFQIPLLFNPTIELNFTLNICALGKRFERLNALIHGATAGSSVNLNSNYVNKYQDMLKKTQSKIAIKSNYGFKNRENIELLLKVSRQLHLDLCATCREVNNLYSKAISLQSAATFLLLTGFTYCLYLIHNEPTIPFFMKMQQNAALGMWIVVSLLRTIFVVYTSVQVSSEAQKTSQIAHEIQTTHSPKSLTHEIHQLSLQILQHPLYFTASGLIVLDFGYVRGFAGSVTTYLMILIQNQSDMAKVVNTLVDGADENTTSSITDQFLLIH